MTATRGVGIARETKKMINRTILFNGASALVLLAGASLYVQPAVAAMTITFDDLTDTSGGFGGTPIANGYQGLNWSNWNVLNTAGFTSNFGSNGAQPGTVSPPNVAYNGFGDEAIFSNNPFTLNSADMTAVWNDNLQVTVTGKLAGVTQDTITFLLSATAPTPESFNWANIDEVDLTATGGTLHSGYSGSGTEVAMDNLTITTQVVPAPLIGHGLPVVLAVGGALLGAKLSERSKKRRVLGHAIPPAAA
jgi:hypothetical protein